MTTSPTGTLRPTHVLRGPVNTWGGKKKRERKKEKRKKKQNNITLVRTAPFFFVNKGFK
jgi:hypothetical protein